MREMMTRFVRGIWKALPLSAGLLVWCVSATGAFAQVQAGAAKVSITPDPKLFHYPLGGYVAPERNGHMATGVHDTCYARALVLRSGAAGCAIVSLDLCFMPANVKTAVMARLEKTPATLPASAVFLSATHSHSAPDPLALHSSNNVSAGALPSFDPKLLDWFADRITQAITEATGKLRPARIGSGQKDGLGLNRNRRGEKLTDDTMTALRVMDMDGKPIAAIFNYAAHPVYFGADMLQVSGDWSGTFTRQIEAVWPGEVVLFLNGAEGDASPNGADEGTPVERIDTYAAKLSAQANKLYESLTTTPTFTIDAWTQDTALGAPKPHPTFLFAALALKATSDQARSLVDRIMPTRCEVSFVRLGDLLLIGVPGEPTAQTGLAIKALARERGVKTTGVVALTNGWLGYLPSPEQYRAGKYEATMSFYGEGIRDKILVGVKAGLERVKSLAEKR